MPNTFLDPTTGVAVKVTGLVGATAASRYVGATASGAPASGTFAVGDFVIDQTAKVWICTAAGSPGTWTAVSGGGGGGSTLTPTAAKTTNYTAAASDFVPCDTTSGAFTLTLPTTPADKTQVGAMLVTQASTNAITIARGGTDVFRKTGGPTSLTLSLVNESVLLQYASATGIWHELSVGVPSAIYSGSSSVGGATAIPVLTIDTGGRITATSTAAPTAASDPLLYVILRQQYK